MKLITIFLLCLLQTGVFAQKTGQVLIDSILQALPAVKQDSLRVKSLNQVGEIYLQFNPAKGLGYADQALVLAEKMHWKKGIARLLNLKGLMVGDTGNSKQARIYFESSYAIQKEINNSFGMIT